MTDATTPAPVRDTTDMPLRLRAAAQAVADNHRAGAGFDRADLDTVSDLSFERYVTLARAVLDAADETDPALPPPLSPTRASIERIYQAKAAGLALHSQGVVLLDIQQDGTVRVSTWTQAAGTPAEALAEWGRMLGARGLSFVPFRTLFGWGENGIPTPLTPEERASLTEAGRAYADRNSPEPRP